MHNWRTLFLQRSLGGEVLRDHTFLRSSFLWGGCLSLLVFLYCAKELSRYMFHEEKFVLQLVI